MDTTVIGLVNPGAMGATVGGLLVGAGHRVVWAGRDRSEATRRRADAAGLDDVSTIDVLADRAAVVLSLCPPSAAMDVADAVAAAGFDGTYVDANAVRPATARAIAERFATFVDGSVVGGPPESGDETPTRLYLSGAGADHVAALFDDDALEVVALDGPVGAASALKMGFAGWTKGTAALAVALRAMARAEGVEGEVLAEWDRSLPGMRVTERSGRAGALAAKAWRFAGELDEIAATMATHDLPDGFHHAAAEVYRSLAPLRDHPDPDVDDLLDHLLD
ncbi:NAD(P)-dependent oxidoreductase [Salsipaludibacter albus]|uniref:NAD(P)-dependent oxidoreductase n=1 Tax=Salsipaludibacter albus TaxID=2849650 RepID=UPI001EE3F0A6|nr:NAD(P)-dependent oxidoreductase [Salsipaludibacter albus]MBY5161535.1 DUF1932 domain-containing protein [Salsipaludibacter albus]